jgi:hypothetical protein
MRNVPNLSSDSSRHIKIGAELANDATPALESNSEGDEDDPLSVGVGLTGLNPTQHSGSTDPESSSKQDPETITEVKSKERETEKEPTDASQSNVSLD